MSLAPRKRRLLSSREFAQREGSVLNRSLNDTGYVARCVLAGLRSLYPPAEGYQRVVARPGRLTAVLRGAWGLPKDRADVRSHALDALVVAVASNQILFALTDARRRGNSSIDVAMPLPWPGFRDSALAAMQGAIVSKSEQKRGRGAAHGNTIRKVEEGKDTPRLLYERRAIRRLGPSDLGRIPNPEANGPLIQALSDWIEAGSPADQPPISPQGDPIRHVRLKLIGKTGVSRDGIHIRGGFASYAGLVRVDVYQRNAKYAVVPVHAVDVATMPTPPTLCPVNRKLREDWQELTDEHRFLFSVHRNSLLRVTYRDGRVIEGFFRGLEQRAVRFTLAEVLVPGSLMRAPVISACAIEKFHLDRLGRRFPVRKETRTWRGKNCHWPIAASRSLCTMAE